MKRYKITVDKNFKERYVQEERDLFDTAFSGKDVEIQEEKQKPKPATCNKAIWVNSREEWHCGKVNLDNTIIYFTTDKKVVAKRYANLIVEEIVSGGGRKSRRNKRKLKHRYPKGSSRNRRTKRR